MKKNRRILRSMSVPWTSRNLRNLLLKNETFRLHSLSLSPVRVTDYGPEKDTGWQNFTNQSGFGRIVLEIFQRRATRKLHLQFAANYHCRKILKKLLSNCHPTQRVGGRPRSSEACKTNSNSQFVKGFDGNEGFFLENKKGNIVFNERPKPCLQSKSLTIFYLILVTSLKRRFAFNVFEDKKSFPFF